MKKTTIEVDEDILNQVAEILHTRGLKATVHRAFTEVLALHARQRALAQLQKLEGLDLDQPGVRRQAWR